jgi:hypothetical protein
MTLRGEWWITDGEVEFADGDVGDRGHESIAIGRLADKFLGWMDIHEDEAWNLSNHISEIRTWLREEHGEHFTEETIQNDPLECAREVLSQRWEDSFESPDQFEDAWFCACGCGNHDARVYMMKYEGWKRVKGNEIETWTLTDQDLKDIVSGLADISWENEGQDIDADAEFNIEIRATKKYHTNIPWSVLEDCTPLTISTY